MTHNWQAYVIALKNIALKKGITHREIAKKSGLIHSNVTRTFSLKYRVTLETISKIADALGVDIALIDRDGIVDVDAALDEAAHRIAHAAAASP